MAQNPEKKIYETKRLAIDEDLHLDGVIDEPAWDKVDWQGDFVQFQPGDGIAPQRQTLFKVLYDDDHLYMGFRAFHENPSLLVSRLARRDAFPGDWVEVNIDSYYDKNTAFAFNCSLSGVKGEEFVTNNGDNWDSNWNPIWYTSTHIDSLGWTAEIKIPLSQLRYAPQAKQIWGLQVLRRDFGAEERSTWQHIPRNSGGWVSGFGELHGIEGIQPKKLIEIQPYINAGLKVYDAEEGNPFEDGRETNLNFGLDGKIGITSDMTLDFTINPDFGQVEADPSALNLNGFQIFFDERRPFFIENNNLFSQNISNTFFDNPGEFDNLFYSRRIGRRPAGDIDVPDEAYVSSQNSTSILGAAKLSGKTKQGWSIGILESITAEEHAKVSYLGQETKSIVEPLTNYFVGSLAKDLNNGKSRIGGMLTSVNRRLKDTDLDDQFHDKAISGGVNFFHNWKDREWTILGNLLYSNVHGTAAKITSTQESFEHYYQRPDADKLDVDASLTSLSGTAGSLQLSNNGGSNNISFRTGVTYRSPGFEINDIGFLNSADEVTYSTWVGYRYPQPFGIFRSLRTNSVHTSRWTTHGEHLYQSFSSNIHMQFKNYWATGIGGNFEFKDVSTKALFGGPKFKQAHGIFRFIYLDSDERKKVNVGINLYGFNGLGKDTDAVIVKGASLGIRVQASDAFSLSFSPNYNQQDRKVQFVDSYNFQGKTEYLAATIKFQTLSTSLRMSYNLSPNLTIQYWGQPFASKGIYSEYKLITDPLADGYHNRYKLLSDSQISEDADGEIAIDQNADGQMDYKVESPNFNFLQFRSNMVLRWEYTPGSEFFLVWTQSNTNSGDPEKGLVPSITEDLFGESPENIFLLKYTYRFIGK